MKSFENLSKGASTKIADNGQEMFTKIVLNQSAEDFDLIPKIATDTSMGEWVDNNIATLATSPWDIDGRSMLDMNAVVLADALKAYRARSTKLGMIMRPLLKNAGLTDVIKSLKSAIATNDGALLMNSIHKHFLPLATTSILEVLTELGLCLQKNGESVDHFASRLENLFLQVDKMGYKTVKDLKLAFCQ